MEPNNIYLRYNKRLLIMIFAILAFIVSFNTIVDPYNIFNKIKLKNFNYYKPEIKRQERLTKILSLKLTSRIDTIIIGSSRPDWSLNPEYYKKITGLTASNMAIVSGKFNEFCDILYKSISLHPEIKTVVLCIDLERFAPIPVLTETKVDDISKKLSLSEFYSVYASIDTTFSSFSTLFRNLSEKDKKRYDYNGMKVPFFNKKINDAFEFMIKDYNYVGKNLDEKTINFYELEKLIKDLKSRNIDVVMYMPPMHITYFEIIDFNNGWDNVDKFKTELAKIQPFYDFMYVHPINTEEIKPDMKNYFESSHATYLVGEKVLDKIFKNEGDFGKLITPKNVYAHNKINRYNFKKWQKENPITRKWVDEILSKKQSEE